LSYLLDTNVLSELRRKTPEAGVVEWFSRRPASTLFLSLLTLGFGALCAAIVGIWHSDSALPVAAVLVGASLLGQAGIVYAEKSPKAA
jgi:predicted nucleic acid-binding protein